MRLEHSDNKVFSYTDGSDSAISEKSWEAALLACGTTIEAIDAVMNGNYRMLSVRHDLQVIMPEFSAKHTTLTTNAMRRQIPMDFVS
jgi:hypothetical protein